MIELAWEGGKEAGNFLHAKLLDEWLSLGSHGYDIADFHEVDC